MSLTVVIVVSDSKNRSPDQSGSTAKLDLTIGEAQLNRESTFGSQGEQVSHSVIAGIPAYNEENTISELVTATQEYADEVVVVDDGSTDETARIASDSGATLLSHAENQGYGATLGTIFQYAYTLDADHLVILDADGQHDPEDIPALISTQRETGAEIVTGSRFVGKSESNVPRYRQAGLFVINSLTNLSLRVGYSYPVVTDTQCGFRAYSNDAIETMATAPAIGSGMGASLDILLQAARAEYDIAEVPTRIDYDVDNASSHNPIVHGLGLLKSLGFSVLRDRPLRVGTALVLSMSAPLGIIMLLQWTTSVAVSVFVTMLISLVFLFGLLLPNKTARRSERTDQ